MFVCVGDFVLFEIEIIVVFGNLIVYWKYGDYLLDDSEYFFLNKERIVFYIINVLLLYVGFY